MAIPGGILALPGRLGRYRNHDLGFVPELNLRAGWQFNDNVQAFVGYTFLCWSGVVRPAEQIDRDVLPALSRTVSGTAAHPFTPNVSDFWAQGLHTGVEIRY